MCDTCKGEGGLSVMHSWGYQFIPCPDSNCDFNKEQAWKDTIEILDKLVDGK